MRCDICDRYVDTKDCKLRSIVPELMGCDGYGIVSRSIRKAAEEKEAACSKKHVEQSSKNEDWMSDIRVGDRVQLKGNPRSIMGCGRLPQYLANGCFRVLGTKGDKIICDWDGTKPFYIPVYALDFLERREKKDDE